VLSGLQSEGSNGTVPFAVSATGTLVYQPFAGNRAGLVWVDREGRRTMVDSTLTDLGPNVALSPDGSQIAVRRSASGDNQIWVEQLATGVQSRLSFDVTDAVRPVWTPDGRRVAFLATRDNRHTAWIRRADGSDSMRPASPGDTRLDEIAFDPLGRYTLYRTEGSASGTRHLLVVKNGVDTVPRILVRSSFDHYAMQVSPDGNWLAYVSEESGIPEVQVRPFPDVDSARFVVSVGGGVEPLWAHDGTELFFRSQRGDMMVAPVTTGRRFTQGTPQRLFDGTGLALDNYFRAYDVTRDGKRFLMVTSGGEDAPSVNVIFNWRLELEKLKAASR
jgi:serine/threonine-protein kinase